MQERACPEFDMVWLNLSLIPVGRSGVIPSFKGFLPAFARRRGRGGGFGTLWSPPYSHILFYFVNQAELFPSAPRDERLRERILRWKFCLC